MKPNFLKKPRWMVYGLYTILLTGIFLYYQFPSGSVRDYLEAKMSEIHPALRLSVGTVEIGFPPSLDLVHARLFYHKAHKTPVFSADKMSVSPEIVSFLRGAPCYNIHGRAYQGTLSGRFRFNTVDMSGPMNAILNLTHVNIGHHQCLASLINRKVSGILEGRVQYSGYRDRWMQGTGTATLNITDARLELLADVMGFESLQFDRISVNAALKEGDLALQNGTFEGPALKGHMTGKIALRPRLSASSIDMKGDVEALQGVLDGINDRSGAWKFLQHHLSGLKRSFVIQGTLASPQFKLM